MRAEGKGRVSKSAAVPLPLRSLKMVRLTVCLLFTLCIWRCVFGEEDDVDDSSSSSSYSTSAESTTSTVVSLPPQESTWMNETIQAMQEVMDDSGRIAGIVIGVLSGLSLVLALVGFCVYKQYLRRNVTSMNFDNPVYRKTTEDQFSLEKNQYQPARSYPSSLEPLTSPGTNEFV